ncbi:RagB/SusD family nutrient uptake outer membrane protein [uncultured Polaribacter sp.]|uniref:RagB/SusD family nutrient uptake outer membrane protein n=1 Tax=uncultured Polaribacter sp. TaxID=174711 RepID=UPI00261F0FE8|nr:RagB/SusD family nutrient uptake outer membrane protein [uncultured Polaribacter sp.]
MMKITFNNSRNLISKSYGLIVAAFFGAIALFSCEDFVDIDPPRTEVTSETVFTTDATVLSAISGIYSQMITNRSFTNAEIEQYTGLASDELLNFNTFSLDDGEFFTNNLNPDNGIVFGSFWEQAYNYIWNANEILEQLENASSITDFTKNQISGEALFVRAFCHFYLVNLFGEIPIVTTTDFQRNKVLSRSSINLVYEQIISDLLEAQSLMTDDFSFANDERVRPNKGAATALLARVYLYQEDWINAEAQATALINLSSTYSLETDLNQVFTPNNTEAIWQLKPATPSGFVLQAQKFVLTSRPSEVSLADDFYNAFETGDNRQSDWVGMLMDDGDTFYYPFKYKFPDGNLVEYSTLFRLGEQYLIRAEAHARQNKLASAIADLDIIRHRAGLPLIAQTNPSISQIDLLDAILKERRFELFVEWGHRWFDLRRFGQAGTVLSAIPLKDWQSTDILFPIPISELEVNPNLLPQNNGY